MFLFNTVAYTPPWIERVKDLQSSAAVNLDSEKKFVKLNEDMKELVRDMRTKVSNLPFRSLTLRTDLLNTYHRINRIRKVLLKSN